MDIQGMIELVKETKDFVENRERAGHIKTKGRADYVTQVDTDIQEFLFRELKARFPDIAFLGEEEGLHEMNADTYWILDPIDGTTNLIHDYQHSVVSLGLYERGMITMGIIYDPFREDVYYAQKGQGSFLNGSPIQVSRQPLENGIVIFGTATYYEEYAKATFDMAYDYYCKALDVRRSGSSALDLCNVAAGRAELFFELRLCPWDYAAGSLIVEEAGGVVTTIDGGELPLNEGCGVLATNAVCRKND